MQRHLLYLFLCVQRNVAKVYAVLGAELVETLGLEALALDNEVEHANAQVIEPEITELVGGGLPQLAAADEAALGANHHFLFNGIVHSAGDELAGDVAVIYAGSGAGFGLAYLGALNVIHQIFLFAEDESIGGAGFNAAGLSGAVVEKVGARTLVADTDTGAQLKEQIADLEKLLEAYRQGIIPQGE